MAAIEPPGFIQALSYNAEITRRSIYCLLERGSTVGSVAGGYVGSISGTPDCQVTAPSSGMSVNVGAGELIVPGSSTTSQSGYHVYVSTQTNLAIAASDPSNPRIDLVCATVQDAAYAGTSNGGLLQVITGTAQSSPVVPSLPTSSLALADVSVPADASSIGTADITNVAGPLQLGSLTTINPNLLFNSSAERGLDGWTGSGGDWTINQPSLASFGNNVVGSFVDQGNNNTTVYLYSDPVASAASEEWTLSGYVAAAPGSSLVLQAYNGSVWSNVATASVTVAGTWTFLKASGVTGAGTTQVRVALASAEGSSSTYNQFGSLKLEVGPTATTWQPSVVGQPWTSYTPTIGGAGWSLGNGTIAFHYRQIDAATVAVQIGITTGNTTTVGSGALSLSVPWTLAATPGGALKGYWSDGTYDYPAACQAGGSTIYPIGTSSTNAKLATFASGSTDPPSGSSIFLAGTFSIT